MDIQHLGTSFNIDYWRTHTEDEFLQEAAAAGCYDWLHADDRELELMEVWEKMQLTVEDELTNEEELAVDSGQLANEEEEE